MTSFHNKKKVLVTGATGLIGKELILPLLERGFEIHAITRASTPPDSKINWINGDLFNQHFIKEVMRSIAPDYLLNAAWTTTGDYLYSDTNYHFLNAGITLLQEFAKNGGKRVIYTGTCFEYKFKNTPLDETDELDVQKNTYTFSKNILNEIANFFCRTHNISYGYGRIFYVYGKNETKSRLTGMIIDNLTCGKQVIIKSGSLYKDYMYTKDIANALVQFLDGTVEGVVNICTGNPTMIRHLATEIGVQMGREDLLIFNDDYETQPPIILGNNRRLSAEVGYQIKYSIPEAIKEILNSR